MKIQPTPTSPKAKITSSNDLEKLYKEKAMQQLVRPPKPRHLSLVTLILSLLFSLAAGMLGAYFFEVYVPWSNGQTTTNTQRPATASTGNQAKQNTQVLSAVETASAAMVAVFPARTADDGDPSSAYPPEEQRGSALLLSEDGWCVTTTDVLDGIEHPVAVTADRKVLEIKHPRTDPASNLLFFRIDGANYPVVSLNEQAVNALDQLFLLSGNGRQSAPRFRAVALKESNARLRGGVELSDAYSRFLLIGPFVSDEERGSALIDAHGDVVGVVNQAGDSGQSTVISATALHIVLNDLLRLGEVHRAGLGVRYLDVGSSAGIPAAIRFNRNEGALITGTTDEPAILPNSPAAGAGLRSGDLLLRIERQLITEQQTLSTLLLGYAPGATVTVQFLREGKEQSVKITLADNVGQ
ncbi:MAG: S1C family serine protease [bacterium]